MQITLTYLYELEASKIFDIQAPHSEDYNCVYYYTWKELEGQNFQVLCL
jgi:hypothetical protein